MSTLVLSLCMPCSAGEHYEPAQWHTWADSWDVAAARVRGEEDPSDYRCGCSCAVEGDRDERA